MASTESSVVVPGKALDVFLEGLEFGLQRAGWRGPQLPLG
jgi:hypothetical protein